MNDAGFFVFVKTKTAHNDRYKNPRFGTIILAADAHFHSFQVAGRFRDMVVRRKLNAISRITMKSDKSPVPLYHQLYLLILQQLSDGLFEAGKPIPSEAELAARYNVSRITVRKSIERLAREGRVKRIQGSGTFPLPRPRQHSNDWLLRSDQALGDTTSVTLLRHELVAAPTNILSFFKLSAGQQVVRIDRVRRDARSPISYTTCFLPVEFRNLVPKRRQESQPISVLLTKGGVKLHEFQDQISATLADTQVAESLAIDVGRPLITMTRLVRTKDGKPAQVLRAQFRPDRFVYTVDYLAEGDKTRAKWSPIAD